MTTPVDRLLTSVLSAYQDVSKPEQYNILFSNTTQLLATLKNPLNLTLLTSHLLTAPAIWSGMEDLEISLRIISLFNTTASAVQRQNLGRQPDNSVSHSLQHGVGIGCDDWVKAVVRGLNEKSPRWRHVLVLSGILLGMFNSGEAGISNGLKDTLEHATVTAINLALPQLGSIGIIAADSVVLATNHIFPLLTDISRDYLDYDNLLPFLIRAMTSMEGYQDGKFLAHIDFDMKRREDQKIEWPSESASFLHVKKLSTKPLVQSMGKLSRLIADAIAHVRSPSKITEASGNLLAFTGSLLERWQRIQFSEMSLVEESLQLSLQTKQVTLPVLWQILKTAIFATIIILQAIMSRTLIDPILSSKTHSPVMASQALLILKNLHFISSRLGSNRLSAYTFINFTSIDILTQCPRSTMLFLRSIYPSAAGSVASSFLARNHDLFYLNTVEHFTSCLQVADSEYFIVAVGMPYLMTITSPELREISEAAHSAMLSVFATPHNIDLTAKLVPIYAFKALVQFSTPPTPLAAKHPLMAETLLEMLNQRALTASTIPLVVHENTVTIEDSRAEDGPFSEQVVIILALLDSLPCISRAILETWLPLSADLINLISDPSMRNYCRQRFWEMLVGGEMDMEKSLTCVAWWESKGGREKVFFGKDGNGTTAHHKHRSHL
ncbi:peroxisomal membrane protein Pex17 [Blumeria hordei DH14]|uniref:Peroxisomal membrane protein Pex17 n=1 Tax=Blumeria graminis f. sp. hordei (strain DH14) TaxID=546991 RepID=N1JND4_BLUG1|nr:peroxisomal membrane protein Pex17 [Blumeria hordei DH14]